MAKKGAKGPIFEGNMLPQIMHPLAVDPITGSIQHGPIIKKSNPNDFAEMERRKKDYTIRSPFNLRYKRSDQRREQRTRMGQLRIRQMESKMVANTTKILHTN
jgi:hypothetical protein